jgi:hypothetical protein
MTRDEFITGYLQRSGLEQYRTPEGFDIEGRAYIALPCDCDDEICEGWKMVNKRDHEEFPDRYEVVPMQRALHGQEGWWTVTCNGEPVRHFPAGKRDLAERYATDPEYRASLVVKKLHER